MTGLRDPMSSAPSDAAERPTVAAVIVCHNEDDKLGGCLDSVAFCDEVVVLLDRCTDGSRDIALSHGARIVEGAWPLQGDRRNASLAAATADWCLEVDCDERVTPEAAREIRAVLTGRGPGYYKLPMNNHIGTRLVRHGWGGSWAPAEKAALFSRGSKFWHNQRIHPRIDLSGPMLGRLAHGIDHFVDEDLSDALARLNRYTSTRARDIRDHGGGGSLGRNMRRFLSRFWLCYVRRKGYREGGYGVFIALMAGLYPLLSYIKATAEPDPEDRR